MAASGGAADVDYARGGAAIGNYVISAGRRDPEAVKLFNAIIPGGSNQAEGGGRKVADSRTWAVLPVASQHHCQLHHSPRTTEAVLPAGARGRVRGFIRTTHDSLLRAARRFSGNGEDPSP